MLRTQRRIVILDVRLHSPSNEHLLRFVSATAIALADLLSFPRTGTDYPDICYTNGTCLALIPTYSAACKTSRRREEKGHDGVS